MVEPAKVCPYCQSDLKTKEIVLPERVVIWICSNVKCRKVYIEAIQQITNCIRCQSVLEQAEIKIWPLCTKCYNEQRKQNETVESIPLFKIK